MKRTVSVALTLLLFLLYPAFSGEHAMHITRGPKNVRTVSFTFDDGPGMYTAKILEILKENGIKATFFVQGSSIKLYPGLLKKISEAGHEIGSHLYSHPNFYKYDKDDYYYFLVEEIYKTEELIKKYTGRKPNLLRMPHGYYSSWVKGVADQYDYRIIHWTAGCDWQDISREEMLDTYKCKIMPGAVFLFHDGGKGHDATLEVLKEIINEVKKRNYKIATVGELLERSE
jgi:peptidoglycan/xylan/chitin deacetylase (PgdA/CDA1 family)